MTSALKACTPFLLMLALGGPARAQEVNLVGVWSWQSQGQSGADQNTISFGPDGRFVRVSRLANGTSLRYQGLYRTTPLSGTRMMLQSQTQGWLPRTICAQAPGFPANCRPAPHPPEMSFPVTFTSPSSIQVEGMTLIRDGNPVLLSLQVPEQLMLAARAPAQPSIRQPVMPTLHPYTTPNGPGVGIAAANHAGAQSFINGYMRGCSKDQYGRLYGCEQ